MTNPALADAAHWIARNVIADEIHGFTPFPLSLRPLIALAMQNDPFLCWPDGETAAATLDEWEWE